VRFPRLLFACFATVVLTPASAVAQSGGAAANRAALLVSTAWLGEHLRDPNLVILHVGDPREYAASHIPGARLVEMSDVSVSDHSDPNALMLEMPRTDTLRAHLAALGISDNSRIVVYYAKDWVSPSTRIIFTLDYAGLGSHASLLDGGMGAWIKEGRAVTDVVPAPRTGTLTPLRTRRIIVDAEYVRASVAKPGVSIVDGRNAGFYDGVQTGGGMSGPHRTGHIASARSVPFSEVFNDAVGVRTNAELEALFTKAGVAPGDTVVGYCHIGQQTTAMLFAARILGHPVLLYDGSFEDWSRHADYPVEHPAEKKKP